MFYINKDQYIQPQQHFTLRVENKTVGTGVVTEVLGTPKDDLWDKKVRKNLMRAEMEKLGYNPYKEDMEKRLKPDYSKTKAQATG